MRVGIIGGGIIGLSIAWELSQRGATVALFEKGDVGREASWAASGILPAARKSLAPDPQERLRGLSHELYPLWAESLRKRTGFDVELRRCGGLYLASSPGEAASLLAAVEYQRDLSIELQILDRDGLQNDEPELAQWANSDRFRAAVLSPDEWKIRPPAVLTALRAACEQSGVMIFEQTQATVTTSDGLATLHARTDLPASALLQDCIVLCGGAWSGQIANALGLSHSVIPIRGQILMYQYDQPPIRRIVNEGHRYIVPRDDGKLLVGSCEEEVGFQKGTTPTMLQSLADWATTILPSLRGKEPIRSWSGLRPATFDGFPMIGKVPEVANLYVAAGHYRSGVHLAPATAVVLADLLEHRTPEVDLSPFRVGRMLSTT